MERLGSFALALLASGLLVLASTPAAQKNAGEDHAIHLQQCAKACSDCMRECETCSRYCTDLVAAGKKEHLATVQMCADCAEFCAAAARIVSRNGPLASPVCDACAKACDTCAVACERFPDDHHMARCAKECRACAEACRIMIKHAAR